MLLLPPAQPNVTQGEIVEFRAKGIMFHRDKSNDSKAKLQLSTDLHDLLVETSYGSRIEKNRWSQL